MPRPAPAPGQLLRRHAVPFAASFISLTALLVANYASKRMPASTSYLVDTALLAIPFVAAMTIPLSVLVAVVVVFTRLGSEGVLDSARRELHGIRRLLTPLIGAATVVAALTLVLNSEIVPRSNARLAILSGATASQRSDRAMTMGELRAKADDAKANAGEDAPALVARYEVEIQKKYALAAAVVVLALTGAALAFLFPSAGLVLRTVAIGVVVAGYYACLVAGESLADRLVLSPFVAMWLANAVLLTFALLVMWWRREPRTPRAAGAIAITV